MDSRTKYDIPFKDEVLRAFAEAAYVASRERITAYSPTRLERGAWDKMGRIILRYARSLPPSASQTDRDIARDIVTHYDPSLPHDGLCGDWNIGVTFAQAQVLLRTSILRGFAPKPGSDQAATPPVRLSADSKPSQTSDWPAKDASLHVGSQASPQHGPSANASITSPDYIDPALTEDEWEQEELATIYAQKTEEQARRELMNLPTKPLEMIKYHGKAFKRDNYIIELIKKVRGRTCQFCGTSIPTRSGRPYIEAAHIKPHGEGWPAEPGNILILCPNHHKEFDFGKPTWREGDNGTTIFELNGKTYDVRLSPES
jgi:hypothetical protein